MMQERAGRDQAIRDAARTPLTPAEQVVYTKTSREWLPAKGSVAIMDSLVDKGWLDKTRCDGRWVYQRVHSLDGEE